MIRGQKGAAPSAPDEKATPEGWVELVFPGAEKVHGKRGEKLRDPRRSSAALEETLCQRPGLRKKLLQRFSENRGVC